LHIGPHLRHGHKIWPWKYDIESLQLFHLKGDSVDLFEPALGKEQEREQIGMFAQRKGVQQLRGVGHVPSLVQVRG